MKTGLHGGGGDRPRKHWHKSKARILTIPLNQKLQSGLGCDGRGEVVQFSAVDGQADWKSRLCDN
jgi:hypothetical protein